jgi:hypothetical protein
VKNDNKKLSSQMTTRFLKANFRFTLVLGVIFAGIYGYGFLSSSWNLPPGSWLRHLYAAWYWDDLGEYAPFGKYTGWQDTSDRQEVSCRGFDTVIFTFGQSLAANSGHVKYQPKFNVINFNLHDGKCYKAMDPLLGPNGNGGSIWSRLGDMLIASGHFNKILFVPIALGSTSIVDWAPMGQHHQRLTETIKMISVQKIKMTHALWVQGSADKTMSQAEYENAFRKISAIIPVSIHVSISTLCSNTGIPSVKLAQQNIQTWKNAKPGPNLDQINLVAERPDGCHFSDTGANRAAELWHQSLTNSIDKR